MKKIVRISLLFLIIVTICSCKSNKEEHSLIEITGEELINNIYADKEGKFIFALYNSDKQNADKFLNDLGNVVKNINMDIYYVDYNHLDDSSAFNLLATESGDFDKNSYYIYDNGKISLSTNYTDFATLYKDLKTSRGDYSMDFVSDETKKGYLEEADKLYESGNIAEAFNALNKAWSLKEAKEKYDKNTYYKLIRVWEAYEFEDDQKENVKYTSIIFLNKYNYFYRIVVTDKYNGFEKPTDLTRYEEVYYSIKGDIIYTSKYDNGKYEKAYQIVSVSDERLSIIDLSNNKKINFVKRS